MRRRDRERSNPSFTVVSRREQPSAWARGALYAGGLSLAALLLASAWTVGRPQPRRRPPEQPAPARSHAWQPRR